MFGAAGGSCGQKVENMQKQTFTDCIHLVNVNVYRKELCTFATGILPKSLDPSPPGLPLVSTRSVTIQATMKLI